ncbi:MAG: ABC transporter substrate-binding protein [Stellaceae bacterium]
MGPSLSSREKAESDTNKAQVTRRDVFALAALGLCAGVPRFANAAGPEGQLIWGIHTTLAPAWLDPAETPGFITPFMELYALHDAVVKPMPGEPMAPCLAESWSASEDGMTYDFVLRKGTRFHNGEPVTAEDVKFSFERYRGSSKDLLHNRVATVETPDPQHVRFKLKSPWPDFMTFYATATGASWVVPKSYVEKVGEDGFKNAPIGAGPYKFVSSSPGIDVVFEAFEQFWRKTPRVKRLVFKMIPDEATRLAALKAGEIDIVYSIRGELGEELRRTPGLTLKPAVVQAPFYVYFPDQWDPKSPWHDLRVRQAANLAIDRKGINDAITLGYSKITGSTIPETFDFYWQPPMPAYDPAKAKQLLAEAGYPGGFDAGEFYCDASYSNVTEAVLDNFVTAGIRCKLRPLERAAFFDSYSHRKLKNLLLSGSGAFGNAATRLEAFVVKGGIYSYGSYPDIDALFPQQAAELDHKKRAAILEKMQQLLAEKAIYAPIWQLGFINGIGPRVGESGFGLMPGYAYTAPYEDITIKAA